MLGLARCHDDEIAVPAISLEIVDPGFVNDQFATNFLEMLHPARKLDSLIDGLGWFVELVCPVQCQTGAVFGGDVQTDAIHVRTLGLPEIYAKVAFGLEGIVEHALARRYFAIVNVVRFAIGNEADLDIFLTQADSKLQASLTAADNCNPHFSSPP